MEPIQFASQLQNDFLLLPGAFVDDYMQRANGEYVKVYLYLFRALSTGREISLETMAEDLDHTQRDITRALYYWDQEQLIRLGFNSKQEITNIILLPIGVNVKEVATIIDTQMETETKHEVKAETKTVQETEPQLTVSMEDLSCDENFNELCFLAQKYTQKTLTSRDTERIGYWYILYQYSSDIIEYLLEYCVEIGHPNINYMEKVILNWHGSGLRTIEEIKEYSKIYNKVNFQVMRAFGLSDRSPAPKELQYIKKWTQNYGFDIEMIEIACEKTLLTIQKPSFPYADSILTAWNKSGCRTKADIEANDANFQKSKQKDTPTQTKPNKFHNFEQRSTDYNKLVADYYGYQD